MVNKRIMTAKAMQSFPGPYPSKYYNPQYLQQKISYYCFLVRWRLPGALHFLFSLTAMIPLPHISKSRQIAVEYCCRNTWHILEPLWWVVFPNMAQVLLPVEWECSLVRSNASVQSCKMQMCFATTSKCFFHCPSAAKQEWLGFSYWPKLIWVCVTVHLFPSSVPPIICPATPHPCVSLILCSCQAACRHLVIATGW